MFNNVFFRQSCHLWDNVEKYSGAAQATVTIRRTTYWIPKATHTHTHNMSYFLLFHCKNGCTNKPECYVTCAFPVFLILDSEVDWKGSGVPGCFRPFFTVHSTRSWRFPFIHSFQSTPPTNSNVCTVQLGDSKGWSLDDLNKIWQIWSCHMWAVFCERA